MKTPFYSFVLGVSLFANLAGAQQTISLLSFDKVQSGSLSTESQNRILNEALMKIPSNDPKTNCVELNRKTRELKLPAVDCESPGFKSDLSYLVGSASSSIVGAKITDGKTTYCLPCSVGHNSFTWGITTNAVDVAKDGGRLIYSEEFTCGGKTYLKLDQCKTQDLKACAADKTQVVKLFCPKEISSDTVACENDNSTETLACLKEWTSANKTACQQATRERFTCSTPIDLPGGGKDTKFVMVSCSNEDRKAFCPESAYTYLGYNGCSEFDDGKGGWQKCFAEYEASKKEKSTVDDSVIADLYVRHGSALKVCAPAAAEYCGKMDKILHITESEFSCLHSFANRTQRNFMPNFDDSSCKALIKAGPKAVAVPAKVGPKAEPKKAPVRPSVQPKAVR